MSGSDSSYRCTCTTSVALSESWVHELNSKIISHCIYLPWMRILKYYQFTIIQSFSPLPFLYYENKNTFHTHSVKQRFSRKRGVAWLGNCVSTMHIHLLSKVLNISVIILLNNFCLQQGIGHTFTEFWAESILDASLHPDFYLMTASKWGFFYMR